VRAQTKAEFLSDNPPLLTIEIVSPNSVEKDTQELIAEYAEAKVLEYWIVNPITETVSVYALDEQVYSLKEEFAGEQNVHSQLLEHWSATAAEMLG
jgi:Uma2 family endonuclease